MSVRYYDEALVNKIQKWIKDPNMRILKPNETARLFQITSDLTNDAPIKLPLIAISRDPEVEVLSTNKKALSYSGMRLDKNEKSQLSLDAIPIQVSYQLDIYTKELSEGDEYLRNFIFNFINHPKLSITIPYNDINFEHQSNVRIMSTIEDTSDIPQRLFSGQFTRWTIRLNIDDAYLFSAPVETSWAMDINQLQVEVDIK